MPQFGSSAQSCPGTVFTTCFPLRCWLWASSRSHFFHTIGIESAGCSCRDLHLLCCLNYVTFSNTVVLCRDVEGYRLNWSAGFRKGKEEIKLCLKLRERLGILCKMGFVVSFLANRFWLILLLFQSWGALGTIADVIVGLEGFRKTAVAVMERIFYKWMGAERCSLFPHHLGLPFKLQYISSSSDKLLFFLMLNS